MLHVYTHTFSYTNVVFLPVFVELELVLSIVAEPVKLLEHKQLLYHSGNINRTCVYTRHSVVYLHEQMCRT